MENICYDAEDDSYTCAHGRKQSLRRECTELQGGICEIFADPAFLHSL